MALAGVHHHYYHHHYYYHYYHCHSHYQHHHGGRSDPHPARVLLGAPRGPPSLRLLAAGAGNRSYAPGKV